VDAGVRALAVLSAPAPGLTDEQGRVPNPRRLAAVAARLRRAQRAAARRAGPRDAAGARRAPSRGWQRAQRRVARLHARASRARADGWHKLTTALAQGFDTVVVEDLNTAGMAARPAPRPDGNGGHARNGRVAKRGLARADPVVRTYLGRFLFAHHPDEDTGDPGMEAIILLDELIEAADLLRTLGDTVRKHGPDKQSHTQSGDRPYRTVQRPVVLPRAA
jgi:hypothetical protein